MAYKNSLSAHKKSDKVKWIIIFTLVFALIAGFVGMAVILNREVKTYDLASIAYEVGELDAEGAEEEANTSIRTKDFYEVDGLTVTVCEEPTITYQLFFYDADKEFVSSSDELAVDYDGTIPETAEYVKVLITPIDDEDGVTFIEIAGYASQVTVTLNR